MSAMVSQITGVSIVYSTVCSGADQGKNQCSASLAFVKGIHRWIPRTKASNTEMSWFDDAIIFWESLTNEYILKQGSSQQRYDLATKKATTQVRKW